MATITNDSEVRYGSRDITINGAAYATDDFSVDTASKEALRTDTKDRPSGRVVVKSEVSGTATLQFAAATATPAILDQFTEAEGTFTITAVGVKQTKGGETKCPISFKLNIGTVVAT